MRRRSLVRLGTIAIATVAACKFTPNLVDGNPGDGKTDAGPCADLSKTCIGDTLRSCLQVGGLATDEDCGWGCGTMPSAHCLQIVPAGSGVTPDQVDGAGLDAAPLTGALIVNGSTGEIGTSGMAGSFRAAGTGVRSGIDYSVNGEVAIFRFNTLQVSGTVTLTGTSSIAFVVDGTATIDNVIDARGFCGSSNQGPGGFAGGAAAGMSAAGPGAGVGGFGDNNAGGGGGGYGGSGGAGGKNGGGNPAGGTPFGDDVITMLVGGGGGGGGGGDGNGSRVGGGGGGAFQIVSNTSITIHPSGGINAGGCGGKAGNGGQAGPGGGAGGTILLEAPVVTVQGKLAVNGGGGAGGDGGGNGSAGNLDRTAATGGTAAGNGTDGGSGGFATHLDGFKGIDAASSKHSGGGGGGVGRIRINTRTGAVVVDGAAVLSPDFMDPQTTATKGSATLN